MRKLHTPKRLFIPIILAILLASCSQAPDSMEAIRDYQPENEYFKASMVSLHFITETAPIPRVDSAFRELIKLYELPVDARGARDGTYTGISPYDAFDYRHQVRIRIENEKIVEIDYNEFHRNGTGKEEDAEYNEEMGAAGSSPAEAYPSMEQQLLDTQDIMQVDASTGATYSLYRFRYAMTLALMQAHL